MRESSFTRFRCHVGHAHSPDSLVDSQATVVETVLWSAVRLFEERAVLSRRLSSRSRESGLVAVTERFESQARAAEQSADVIRSLLLGPSGLPADENAPNE
jgi:two-component system chemotaxis response regulator CheB